MNVASRMESHGLPSRIQISESSYFLIRDGSSCEARGEVDVKGRGLMRTWWLQGVRSPS